MIRIQEAILVEGRYDVNTVRQLVDTIVLETGGFRIFRDDDKLKLIRRIAAVRGLVILTDSDGAGFVIRNFIKGAVPKEQVKQAYIPDILGKERRKRYAGKEGKLGVEGMRPAVIEQALRLAGATFLDESPSFNPFNSFNQSNQANQAGSKSGSLITKADLYEWGLSGRPDSAARRALLLQTLELPEHMTANALLEFINAVGTRAEIEQILAHSSPPLKPVHPTKHTKPDDGLDNWPLVDPPKETPS